MNLEQMIEERNKVFERMRRVKSLKAKRDLKKYWIKLGKEINYYKKNHKSV